MEQETFFCLEDFEDQHENIENEQPQLKFSRSRGKGRDWVKIKEFTESSEAEAYVNEQNLWCKTSNKRTLDGEKIEFRCKYGKYRINECPAAIYLLYHATDVNKVSLFSTNCEHLHYQNNTSRGLDQDKKKIVEDLFKKGVQKPNAILAVFRRENIIEPPKTQLTSFLRTLRTNTYGPSTISGNELVDWCKKKSVVPDDEDKLFVLDYNIICDTGNQDIKIVLSTRRLLKNINKSCMVQADSTYKLIWQGYPVIIMGSSDKNKTFHPFVLAVCNTENENDFSFIFSAVCKYKGNTSVWKPTILLADASIAITNGFNKTFKGCNVRLMCYFHVIQAIDKKLRLIKNSEELKNDISALQLCSSTVMFDRISHLFLLKWFNTRPDIHEFLEYFQEEWLKKNKNWYEGAALGYPSTNNGIEATNAIIKKEHTLRERLPVGQFLNCLDNLLLKWSKERDHLLPTYKPFSLEPTISIKDWTEAYQWVLLNKNIRIVDDKFYIASSNCENDAVFTELFTRFTEKNWETFDEYKKINFSFWVIEKKCDEYECSCPAFMKNYKCKHALGLKIRLKVVNVPQEAKMIPLGNKRKRGRPAKAKKALIVQN